MIFFFPDDDKDELATVLKDFLEESPGRGAKLANGHIRSLGLKVSRQNLRDCMKEIDPIGHEARLRRRMKRRIYHSEGLHHVWHIDGWHKLIKYGFVVHAGIDGNSKCVVFIRCSDNNESVTVLDCFKAACREQGIVPFQVRSDRGGENVLVCSFMKTVHGVEANCFLAKCSSFNQRIERLWRDVRASTLETYRLLFAHFETLGLDVLNIFHMFILHYLFKDRINESLLQFKRSWNNHGISTENNKSPLQLMQLRKDENFGTEWIEETMGNFGSASNDVDMPRVDYPDIPYVELNKRHNPFSEAQYEYFKLHIKPFTLETKLEDCWKDFELVLKFVDIICETM